MTTTNTRPRVIIIGAGVAGITALHTFRSRGFTDVKVLEKGADVGGVWHWNRYPGLTCDVPSQIYQFGFAPKPDWSHIWAGGAEIQRYHRAVVDELGLSDHIQLNTEVVDARWEAATSSWTVRTADGETLTAEVVVCATGVLHHPAYPEIAGLDTFAGEVVHTARWDPTVTTSGRHIAVIGTGSTGVQVVSALVEDACGLTHYVRSPQWVLWAPMSLRQSRCVARLLETLPAAHAGLHKILLRGSAILADITTRPSWRRRAVQTYARMSLRLQVRDRDLRDRLTPDYEPLCKRQVVSGTYYRAIQQPHAHLVTEQITEVTARGIRTADGREHPTDVIVLATGFRAHDYMRPMTIVGRDGRTLDDAWRDGPRAYRMTAIPGFPNLFTILGPNSPTGSISLQHTSQLTADYIVHWLEQLRAGGVTSVEVTDEATEDYNRRLAEAMEPTVWNTGCHSWYIEGGSIDLFPYMPSTLASLLDTPDHSHFHIGTAPSDG
ncbi:flavin-containing monooxygenase [Gordonia lacunae]|uniref:flavin-containing monooxygenase n=1 Tax=Gordonia lacunae TaxID=417102 RepID=UPI0039E5052F